MNIHQIIWHLRYARWLKLRVAVAKLAFRGLDRARDETVVLYDEKGQPAEE
jgi:hypothetical protein